MNVGEAYLKGRLDFMGVDLLVAPGALVPRAETELLGRTAVEAIEGLAAVAPRVIDMCCGAGNLACAIALRLPRARVWAGDLTESCIEVARRNVERLGLLERVQVRQGDLFESLQGLGLENTIDAIVCNPPYISGKRLEGDRAHLLELEPREAFDGGPYGLSIHQRVLGVAPAFLRAGGILLFEIGLGQERQVELLFKRARAYDAMGFARDAEGNARVAYGRRKSRA